jgi:hypothetical protein
MCSEKFVPSGFGRPHRLAEGHSSRRLQRFARIFVDFRLYFASFPEHRTDLLRLGKPDRGAVAFHKVESQHSLLDWQNERSPGGANFELRSLAWLRP